jgi:phage-related minor tail protein
MTDIGGELEGVLADLLEPVEEADKWVGIALDKVGEGLELAGAGTEELAAKVEALAGKIEQLQQRLRGGGA